MSGAKRKKMSINQAHLTRAKERKGLYAVSLGLNDLRGSVDRDDLDSTSTIENWNDDQEDANTSDDDDDDDDNDESYKSLVDYTS